MRYLYPLAFLVALSGCATTIPESNRPQSTWGHQRPQDAEPPPDSAMVALQARADSLLALSPDSLTAAQLQWLQVYQNERERRDVQSTRAAARQSMSAATGFAFVGLIASIVLSVVLLQGI